MEETAQNFEKRFLDFFNVLQKFYVTHRIYEILSKSLVPIAHSPEKKSTLCHIHFRLLGWQINARKFPAGQLLRKADKCLVSV
jgi:hypothetical protein